MARSSVGLPLPYSYSAMIVYKSVDYVALPLWTCRNFLSLALSLQSNMHGQSDKLSHASIHSRNGQ
jgi:hypothetical protein